MLMSTLELWAVSCSLHSFFAANLSENIYQHLYAQRLYVQ